MPDGAIRATARMALAFSKTSLQSPSVKALVGEFYLADINVPSLLYKNLDVAFDVGPVFADSNVTRVKF